MAKMKKETSKSTQFAVGGSGHMFGKQSAGKQAPGTTAHQASGDGKFAQGGKGKMFGFRPTYTARPGITGC